MNRKEGKKIAVMAAIIMGFMMFAFMPMASATVTSFTVTPSTGLAGAVDSYNALVTTDGVTTMNIAMPAGFLAVTPTTGGVEIARVDFWNSSTKAYYGYATITSNNVNPTTQVDIQCKFGDDAMTTTQPVNYAAGGLSTFVSGFEKDTSSAIIRLPTEMVDGSIEISITCTAFQLDDVMIAIKQFVRNPLTAGDYDFFADGVKETVSITAAGGRGIVFRGGAWFVDTNGDHIANLYFGYGIAGDVPLVWDVGGDNGVAIFRNGMWCVDTTGNQVADLVFGFGIAGDVPLVGDCNRDGTNDIAVFRNGMWCVDTTGNHVANLIFGFGIPGDVPLVGDLNRDGTDDIAVVRGNVWFVDTTGNHVADLIFCYGLPGDIPLVGDFDRNGIDDIAIFRDGMWCVDTTGDRIADEVYGFGIAGDVPLVGDIG
jgi:hypothetical protein